MDYMLAKFFGYVLFAFVMGATVGWFTCSRNENQDD